MIVIPVELRCWDTLSAPGPKIEESVVFDVLPRVGEQVEFDESISRGAYDIPDGVYYVHKVRHVYDGLLRRTRVHVEVTTQHPGTVTS